MNHREHFLKINQFLKPYQNLWKNEIMLMSPDPIGDYPAEWLEELRKFHDLEDIVKLEKKDVFELIKTPSLVEFYRQIEQLSHLPAIPPI